ncbi:MAG: hypothetical protein O9270_05820 [Aquidulcibacter sp.]|uniref:hypothetical protein n=1 Tax=Aquidulcibacter sp. TaxID=2052990 RepID=UPI0022C78D08|nr:hypothetical protein [Aquidulcibacter sp.]MCZ8207696.1 hypothetical protein [Aquidulcibacter sp.]
MTTIWPNGFAGGVDWRSWSDGLWQTASAGGLGPDTSGEPEATDTDAPAVVITNAPPSTLETYAPPSGMTSDFFTEIDLAAYFSLIGYDPAAIEEMNANGSYRSEHDIYQANGGLQSQAEAAWRRSGQWALGNGFNDVGRELFLDNYMDSAYGVDPEAGTSRNTANMADYLMMMQDTLNAASKAEDKQKFEELRSALEKLGFNVRRVADGVAYDRDPTDSTTEVFQKTKYVLDLAGSPGSYQTGGIDGFQLVGRAGGITTARGSDNSARRSDLTLPIYISGGGEGYLPGEWVGRNVIDYLEDEPGAQYWHMETVAVRDAIKARHDANLPVILIGHSFGGSEAISNALWAKGKGIRVDLLITVDPVGVPDYVPKLALAPYAERLRGVATTWVNVTADKPGIGPGDVPATFWKKTPQIIQEKATRTVSARNADHADFDKMMFAIGAKGLIEGVRK